MHKIRQGFCFQTSFVFKKPLNEVIARGVQFSFNILFNIFQYSLQLDIATIKTNWIKL